MVFNATFNNISAISFESFLLVGKTGSPEENHRPAASHWQTLSHDGVSGAHRLWKCNVLSQQYYMYVEKQQ